MENLDRSYILNVDGLNVEVEVQDKDEQKQKTAERFIAIRKQTGMNRKEFAEWLGIPYRTMQDWERGISQVPDYVLRLVDYKVAMEKGKGRITMKKLFILGNGFDIASGLKTGYKDFRQWFISNHLLDYNRLNKIVQEEAFGELEVPQGILGSQGEIIYDESLAAFFYALVTYANPNDITWNGFEANLSRLPFYCFEDICYYDGDDEFEEADFVEQEGNNLARVFVDAVNIYFSEWVKYIHKTEKPTKRKKLISDNLDSIFLTFNYTDTLEEFYKILDEKICHIHGYARRTDKIIIGHGDEVLDYSEFEPLKISSYMSDAKIELKKPVREIIAKNNEFFQNLGKLKEIYIIGWGLDNPNFVDAPYLKEIIKHTDDSTIIYFDSFDASKLDAYKNTCNKNGFEGIFGISDSDKSQKYLI